jgi:uncharacterized protein (DUF2252 family)
MQGGQRDRARQTRQAPAKSRLRAAPAPVALPEEGSAKPLAAPARSVEERMVRGRALRDRVSRADHGRWKRSPDRAEPLDILRAQDADRLPELVPIRYGRMLASPFAFYRGAAAIMAADLGTTPATGERLQACGDCHLMNFGGFATPERNIIFDINDFDETLPAPWEWDIKRLAASFVLAARSLGLSDPKARDMAVTCVRSYREHLAEYATMDPLSVWYARITVDDFLAGVPKALKTNIRSRVDQAMKRGSDAEFPRLAEVVAGRLSIRDAPPLIFHPEISHTTAFQAELGQLFHRYRDTLADDRREIFDRYTLVDAAIKVVGIGSVGRRCWIALFMSAANDPLFLQVKEAVASVMEPFAGRSVYPHHGQRVVVGQRIMQPASDLFLGWLTAEAAAGRQFYVRQLRDAKIKPVIETMDGATLTLYAARCGWSLARAHAKAGDAAVISGYLGGSGRFDEALGDFSIAYADQTERDHASLKSAVRRGVIAVHQEV